MCQATQRAGTVVGMLARLTWLVGLVAGVMADGRRGQGIGSNDTGSPAGRDRCQNLHRQGHQDDRKEFP